MLVGAGLWWPTDPEGGAEQPTPHDRPPPTAPSRPCSPSGRPSVPTSRPAKPVPTAAAPWCRSTPWWASDPSRQRRSRCGRPPGRSPFRTAALRRRRRPTAGAAIPVPEVGGRAGPPCWWRRAPAGWWPPASWPWGSCGSPTGRPARTGATAGWPPHPAAGGGQLADPDAEPGPSGRGRHPPAQHLRPSVRWTATPGATWLDIEPSAGLLSAGGVAELDTRITASAPEGARRSR